MLSGAMIGAKACWQFAFEEAPDKLLSIVTGVSYYYCAFLQCDECCWTQIYCTVQIQLYNKLGKTANKCHSRYRNVGDALPTEHGYNKRANKGRKKGRTTNDSSENRSNLWDEIVKFRASFPFLHVAVSCRSRSAKSATPNRDLVLVLGQRSSFPLLW